MYYVRVYLGDAIISFLVFLSVMTKLMRLVVIGGEALGAILNMAPLLPSKSRQYHTVISIKFSGFWLLAGPVSETGALQTGNFRHTFQSN